MGDATQDAARRLTMIPLIREQPGITIEELAERLGCSRDTIISDLNAVLMCGVPPYLPNDYVSVSIKRNEVSLDFADHFRRPVRLTLSEAVSLVLAIDSVNVGDAGPPTRLRRRIAGLLPGVDGEDVEHHFHMETGQEVFRGVLDKLHEAVLGSWCVRMTYYTASRDALTERVVAPYGIVELEGKWYVVGHCRRRDQVLPFRVDRIRELVVTEEPFTVPADFDIEDYRKPEMYFPGEREMEVRFRVNANLAARIREEMLLCDWTPQPDGSLVGAVHASRPEWVVAWASQYGPDLEILSPPELRRRMREQCDRLLDLYEN